jgi:ribosomal protein S18 acetylase RimI-like enzyme
MSATERPFGTGYFDLAGCRLIADIEDDDATRLGDLLAGLEPWRTLGYSADGLRRYLLRDDPGLHRFRIAVDGATAGALCVRYPWLRGAYIELIGLDPAHAGKGIGAAVLGFIEDDIRRDAANLWAIVSTFNQPARRFYARHGFAEVASLPGLVKPGFTEILLRKTLGS